MSSSKRLLILETWNSASGRQLRHDDRLDELARLPVLLAVVEEEVFQRDLAPARRRDAAPAVAPSAIRAGGRSPIGEPLAMLPPIVPALRTCSPPKRRISSSSWGESAASARRTSTWLAIAPMRRCVALVVDLAQRLAAAEIDDRGRALHALGHPEPDIGRARDQHRVRMLRDELGQRRRRSPARGSCGRPRPAPASRRRPARRAARRWPAPPAASRAAAGHPGTSRSAARDDRLVAGAAAEIAGQRILDPRRRSARPRSARARTATSRCPACRSRIASRDASTSACCTGCSVPSAPLRCSTVSRWQPSSVGRKRMQALIAS